MLVLLTTLMCSSPYLINKTNKDWDEEDKRVRLRCEEVCKQDKELPCLRTLIKFAERHYYCGCGPKE